MRWFLSYWICVICGDDQLVLHAEGMGDRERCEGCGYMMEESMDDQEVPESFAKSEHEKYGLIWEGK